MVPLPTFFKPGIFPGVLLTETLLLFSVIMTSFTFENPAFFSLEIFPGALFQTWHFSRLMVHFFLTKSCNFQRLFPLKEYFFFSDYTNFTFENIHHYESVNFPSWRFVFPLQKRVIYNNQLLSFKKMLLFQWLWCNLTFIWEYTSTAFFQTLFFQNMAFFQGDNNFVQRKSIIFYSFLRSSYFLLKHYFFFRDYD